VIDTRKGTVRYTIRLGQAPWVAVLNAAAKRLFVVGRSNNTVAVLDTAALGAHPRAKRKSK
jgi:DNA-binding beta-propeller fold protein YncE